MNDIVHERPGRMLPGFSLYRVADDGEVVSYVHRKPRVLAPIKMGHYRGYQLKGDDGSIKKVKRHRLVCEAFHGPCPEGMECRHLDGDRLNDHPRNLAWGTRSENARDKERHGTAPIGAKHPMARLDDLKVSEMRERRAFGLPFREIAEEFGVTTMTAYRAVTGQSWSHLK